MEFSSSADIFDEAHSWQWRVVRASFGTTTGCLVQAMLAKQPKSGPAFGIHCDIDADGYVTTMVRRIQEGKVYLPPQVERIGTTIAVRDNLRELCDHCKLNDNDRQAFFAEFQKWIRKDYRVRIENQNLGV